MVLKVVFWKAFRVVSEWSFPNSLIEWSCISLLEWSWSVFEWSSRSSTKWSWDGLQKLWSVLHNAKGIPRSAQVVFACMPYGPCSASMLA